MFYKGALKKRVASVSTKVQLVFVPKNEQKINNDNDLLWNLKIYKHLTNGFLYKIDCFSRNVNVYWKLTIILFYNENEEYIQIKELRRVANLLFNFFMSWGLPLFKNRWSGYPI